MAQARRVLKVIVDIVRKREVKRTFEVLPRRWVVERTLSWISDAYGWRTITSDCPSTPRPR